MSPADVAFERWLAGLEPGIRSRLAARYLEAWRIISAVLDQGEVERAFADGTMDRLLQRLADPAGPVQAPVDRLRSVLEAQMSKVAEGAAARFPARLGDVAFTPYAPYNARALREFSAQATARLHREAFEAVTEATRIAVEEGVNARQAARTIRGAVGLSPAQVGYVENFRRELLSGDRSALQRVLQKGTLVAEDGETLKRRGHAMGEGLSARQMKRLQTILGREALGEDEVDAMVEAYRKRLVALNTESHVKTATLQAQKRGNRLAWEDLIARGEIRQDQLRRRWITTRDGRQRDEHDAMHLVEVGFDEPFDVDGVEELIPGESTYNCRCLARVFVHVPGLEEDEPPPKPEPSEPPAPAAVPAASAPPATEALTLTERFGSYDGIARQAVVGSGFTNQDSVERGLNAVLGPFDYSGRFKIGELSITNRGRVAAGEYRMSQRLDGTVTSDRLFLRRSWVEGPAAQAHREREAFRAAQVRAEEALATGRLTARGERAARQTIDAPRWTATEDAADPVFALTAHEAGHTLMFRYGRRFSEGQSAWTSALGRAGVAPSSHRRVSEYAASSTDELFAEVVSMVAQGRRGEVPADILAAYDDMIGLIHRTLRSF